MTTNNENLSKAQRSIKSLFNILGIKRVVCVDDQYNDTPTLERFKNLYNDVTEDERQSILGLNTITSDDFDLLDNYLDKFWTELSDKDKNKLSSQLRAKSTTHDTQYARILKDLLQSYLVELSLAQWRRNKPKYIVESKEIKTLFLFDQDFSKEEGGSREEGFKLIEDVLTSEGADSTLCGLLSHTFKPEDEQKLLEEYTKNHSENKDSFIFISKRLLSNDPTEFARRVKLTILSPMCKLLKTEVADIIEQAHKEAFQKVEQVSIYDFEQIIFHSSILEGVWEPDTLFRLFGFYSRALAREKARVRDKLYEIAAGIRPISLISTDSDGAPEHRSREIQRFELYEDEKYTNDLYMPIELGDVFEITLNGRLKKFILLAQPCDLMVRKNGNRKQTVTEAILAEIVNSEDLDNKDDKGRPLDQDTHYELQYFNKNGTKAFVSFQKKYSMKLFIIDLCVYQKDGRAEVNINQNCPKYIIPTWQKHYEKLVEKAKQAIDQYRRLQDTCKTLSKDETDYILNLALPRILELPIVPTTNQIENIFTGNINPYEGSITYDLRRCGRLCQSHSSALLAKFASFFARNAFEHDFGGDKDR